MNTRHSKLAGSLFTVLVLVVALYDMPSIPARAGVLFKTPPDVSATFINTIIRVSVDSSGIQGNDWSNAPSISADGRFVAFASRASNLVGGDTNGTWDIFLRDTQTGTTRRMSVDSSGVQGNYYSVCPSISADGRYVAFQSYASNLISADTNGSDDIFLRDTQMGTTTLVSLDSSGVQGNSYSFSYPSISADGRYVAFQSYASNLVNGDTNKAADIFVHDRQTGITTRVSLDSSGTQGNGGSFSPSISADGRYVAFESGASNLVSEDTNNAADIFVHDKQTETTTRVSVDSSGIQGNGGSSTPAISMDGRYVAFDSPATNLVSPGTTEYRENVYVHDRDTDGDGIFDEPGFTLTTLISVNLNGNESNGISYHTSISANGRYVAFGSYGDNLVSGDTGGIQDIFLHDRQMGSTSRLSLDSSGAQGNDGSYSPSISADGRYVVFNSDASNLVSGDTNGARDVFVVPVTIFTHWIYLPLLIR